MIGATSAANVGVESAEITYVATEAHRTPRTTPSAVAPPLPFLCLLNCKRLECRACQAERRRFSGGALDIPFVHRDALYHPQRRSAIRARAVNEGRLVCFVRDRLDEGVHDGRIRRCGVERDVNVVQPRGFGGCCGRLDL